MPVHKRKHKSRRFAFDKLNIEVCSTPTEMRTASGLSLNLVYQAWSNLCVAPHAECKKSHAQHAHVITLRQEVKLSPGEGGLLIKEMAPCMPPRMPSSKRFFLCESGGENGRFRCFHRQ
ncbi:hypothetical protein AXG93_1037s1000 [Marchantia polymorpha subsp. ruderalis]|uniref:Uncharacterized protein n=1 Tax=Marchantia polymorpha subsp. ruderalis TaxID=1480154 RepID=A0A176WCF0_MARPO|nr:hypothetical protein AXG93_1037s1000 [Marchantia polymorpha subsp. ruderalis]